MQLTWTEARLLQARIPRILADAMAAPTSNITGTGGTTTANSMAAVNPRVLLPSAFVQDDIKLTRASL